MYARPLCSFQPLPCVTDYSRAHALQKGHSGPVTALAYNAEGDKLASYSLVDGRMVVWATKASFFEYFSTAPSPQHNFNAGKADRTLKLASAHAHQLQSSDGVVCGGSFVVACCACGWVWNRRTHSASRGPQGAASVGWSQAPAAHSPLGSSGPRHLPALIVPKHSFSNPAAAGTRTHWRCGRRPWVLEENSLRFGIRVLCTHRLLWLIRTRTGATRGVAFVP